MAYGGRKRGSKRYGKSKGVSFDVAKGTTGPRQMASKLDYRFKAGPRHNVKPEPFPTVLKTRMKFSSNNYNFAVPALGAAGWNTFRVNSIWDPDLTGIGKTVTGWSVMNMVYSRYLVTGCKISVQFYDPDKDGATVGVRLRHANSAPTAGQTLQQLIEQPMTYTSGLSNTGSQTKNFNFFVRPWSLIGISKSEYMNNTTAYSADMGTMPVPPNQAVGDGCVFDVFAVHNNPATLLGEINVVVKIVYYVTLYNRKALTSTGL